MLVDLDDADIEKLGSELHGLFPVRPLLLALSFNTEILVKSDRWLSRPLGGPCRGPGMGMGQYIPLLQEELQLHSS